MATGTRLLIGAIVMLGATTYWAYVGASSSWQYYVTVDECMASTLDLRDHVIRVSGSVAPGSLWIDGDRLAASFRLAGTRDELAVRCEGPVPDNLAEGRQVIVEGWVDDQRLLHGSRVLTRCASKYASDQPNERTDSSRPRSAQ